MFEKPMITDLNLLNKLNKYCLKNKILIRVNYTFNEIKFLKKIIPLVTEKKSKLIYTLSFNHPFYENKKKFGKSICTRWWHNKLLLISHNFLFSKL